VKYRSIERPCSLTLSEIWGCGVFAMAMISFSLAAV
jgi:hypothetical protein